jgi:hypothetical protein
MTQDAETGQTEQVTFTIANLRAVEARDLFALLDVEVRVAGLSFWIMGVQGRRARNGGQLYSFRPIATRTARRDLPWCCRKNCGSPWSMP